MRVLLSFDQTKPAANPYLQLLVASLRAEGVETIPFSIRRLLTKQGGAWHLHWPESAVTDASLLRSSVRAVAMLALTQVARWLGVKVVWTVHNLHPHESYHPRVERWFMRRFVRRLSATLHLSRSGLEQALAAYPALRERPAFVTLHGHYRDYYRPRLPSPAAAKAELGLSSKDILLAFVGTLRRYKGIPALLRAFGGVTARDVTLLVAGECRDAALAAELRQLSDGNDRIQLRLGRVMDETMVAMVQAADLVVLPFADVLNSGSALLALSLDTPVLVPRMGALIELQGELGPAWVRTYSGPLTDEVVESAIRATRTAPKSGRAPLAERDWSGVARATAGALRAIVGDAAHDASPVAAGTAGWR
jgi:beta-1,4-mannosyltransferase